MATNENMVNDNFDEGLDENFLDIVGSEEPEEQGVELGEELEKILSEDDGEQPTGEEQPEEEQDEQRNQGKPNGTNGEPGYVKKRVAEAVEKAIASQKETLRAEVYAEVKADFDRQMKPLLEKLYEDEAQALVSNRKVSDIELARELVRRRHGVPEPTAETQPAQQGQPRNAQGQFASKEQQPDDNSIASTYLAGQAKRVQDETGLDVMAVFNKDANIRNKVLNGEMDFRDIAKQMQASRGKRPPAPMRTPNQTDGSIKRSIMDLSDEQFERLEREVQKRG